MAYYQQHEDPRIYANEFESGYGQQQNPPPYGNMEQGPRISANEFESGYGQQQNPPQYRNMEQSPRIYTNEFESGYGQQQNPPPYRNMEQGYGYNNQSEYRYSGPQSYHSHPQGQIVRVCSKANPDYALGVRDGRAMLVYYNPSDPTQQWVKDESRSNSVRDAVGHPAFCLVNKATGQALRHAPAVCQEVLLTKYEGGCYDESVMWSESEDMGYGFRSIRMANDIGLNLDAFQGDRKHGGIEEGNRVVLWEWNKHDNQLWKISPSY